jgi:hypothetical protein
LDRPNHERNVNRLVREHIAFSQDSAFAFSAEARLSLAVFTLAQPLAGQADALAYF